MIMERRVGVSPVAVLTALLIGGALWGLIGAILAIPTAAILAVFVEQFASNDQPLDRLGINFDEELPESRVTGRST
jgi:predicted PurR-regulated permease PerM